MHPNCFVLVDVLASMIMNIFLYHWMTCMPRSPKEKPPTIKGKPEIRIDPNTRQAVLVLRVISASAPSVQWLYKDAALAPSERVAVRAASSGDEHELSVTISDVCTYPLYSSSFFRTLRVHYTSTRLVSWVDRLSWFVNDVNVRIQ